MPRNYQKRQDGKRTYSNYTDESLDTALAAVRTGILSERKAAKMSI